jgi:uncharacterized membrane protein YesL
MNIFRTFWKSVRELFDDLFILAIVNVLWLLINALALLIIVAAYLSGSFGLICVALLLSAISFGPSNAGLYTIAERVTEGRTSSWRDFIAGLRANAKLSWQVYGLWMLGLVVLLFNMQFYSLNGSQISVFLTVLFLYLLVVWLGILIYIGPLMLIQTDKRLRVIARNAALMTFGRPLFTLGTLILMAIIFVTSIWLVILLFLATVSFLALWGFRATLTLIAEAEARRNQAAEKATQADAPKGRGGQVRPRD